MIHPVLILDVPPGTALLAGLNLWLDSNDVPGKLFGPLVHYGDHVTEDVLLAGPNARSWTIQRPMPVHLLARLADAGALCCSASYRTIDGTVGRCTLPVSSAGVHPGSHEPDPLDQPEPQDWHHYEFPGVSAPIPRPARHRATIRLDESTLVDLLRLPAGQRVIGFRDDPLTLSIFVHLEGDGLPETPEGGEPSCLNGGILRLSTLVYATDPHEIHTGVLAALDDPGYLEAWRSRQARIRQLNRHAPIMHGDIASCSSCALMPGDPDPWPCPDYQDAAAAVLVTAWMTPTRGEDTES